MRLRTALVVASRIVGVSGALLLALPAAVRADYGVPSYAVRPATDANLKKVQAAIFECGPDHPLGCRFPEIVKAMSGSFRFPRPVKVTVEQCGFANAMYVPRDHGIHVCYELADQFLRRSFSEGKTPSQTLMLAANQVFFVLAHELGHYAISELDLGVMGKEEDAADQFATVFMVAAGIPELAVDGAISFGGVAAGELAQSLPFWDEHSLGPQRFFDIMCSVYGSDPKRFSILVPSQIPPDRAGRCPTEFMRHKKAWETAMAPFETSGARSASASTPQAPSSGQAREFAGNWSGTATEKTPQGVLTYDVNALFDENGQGTFGARTKVPSPRGPVDVLVNGQGLEASVVAIQGRPTLRLAVRQLVYTIVATGERSVELGNTYYLQRGARGLVGRDETGEVQIDLGPQPATGSGQTAPGAQSGADFTGSWVGKATEKTPEGTLAYEVNAVIRRDGNAAVRRSGSPYQATFGGRTAMNTPQGPVDVLINGDGVEAEVGQVNGTPTLRLTVKRLIRTVLATGARDQGEGNTYYLQLNGGRLVGKDESGSVQVELERR